MKRWLLLLPFIALAVDGLVDSATGVVELRRAVTRSEAVTWPSSVAPVGPSGTFAAADPNLQALNRVLEEQAQVQSALLNRTLRNCVLGLAFFILGTGSVVFALWRVSRMRATALRRLASANQALECSQQMDRRRLTILEMVGTHAPLVETLAAIAELPSQCHPEGGAAVWSAAGDKLLYQASAGLPEHVTNILRAQAFERVDGRLNLGPETRKEIAGLAARCLRQELVLPLTNVAGDTIGLLLVFFPLGSGHALALMHAPDGAAGSGCSVQSNCAAAQMTQLAALAIDNALIYERLAFQAQHDVLTGLPNRLLFQDRVQQAILRAQRNRGKVAVLWLDIDRFKQINDSLGHRVGDELLVECARRLKAALRESDTAARIAADEFVVLVADLESAADVQVIAAKITKNTRFSMDISGVDVTISTSAGISIYPDHGADPSSLMRNADLAMYQAKRLGRDTFQVFDQELGDSLGRRRDMEAELKHAVDNGELSVKYQPLIGRAGRLEKLEALARWESPKFGPVSPAEFIPLAEDAGLILQIGEWVSRTVCETGARWIAQGLDVPRIAVNVSGLQFAGRSFADKLEAMLAETGFPAAKLELEVTETALVTNYESALQQIAHLRELGVTFALDDFGTGYSSLNRLRTLPVDSVKIDRSFIKDLDRMIGDSTTLVRGIIGLAHNLRLTVVGEGVETKRQLDILRSLGCDLIQGFFLHRPLPVEAAEQLIRRCRPAGLVPVEVLAPAVDERLAEPSLA